ncbi:hypothetical protein [Archangium sp.]|uniref:hypothetical protein n=1 Tax=Archangium sp. TaxID=1872627 RepID=UPI00286BF0B1|nr:hypothetical protein [Archangium sp.]
MLAVCLLAWSSEAQESRVRLPLEVLGHAGAVETVQLELPFCCVEPARLWMRVHGLGYAGKASVQFNDSAWIPLGNDTARVEGLGKVYGGIGGAYATLRLSIPIPEGALQPGSNWVSFRFNPSGGMSIGYRVLDFELLSAEGEPLLDRRMFEVEDPSTWTPPRPKARRSGGANRSTPGGPSAFPCAPTVWTAMPRMGGT